MFGAGGVDLGAAVDHTGIGIGLSGECFGGLGGGSAHVAHRAEAIGGWGHLMADRVSFVDHARLTASAADSDGAEQ